MHWTLHWDVSCDSWGDWDPSKIGIMSRKKSQPEQFSFFCWSLWSWTKHDRKNDDFVEIGGPHKFVEFYGPEIPMTLQNNLFKLAGFSISKSGLDDYKCPSLA